MRKRYKEVLFIAAFSFLTRLITFHCSAVVPSQKCVEQTASAAHIQLLICKTAECWRRINWPRLVDWSLSQEEQPYPRPNSLLSAAAHRPRSLCREETSHTSDKGKTSWYGAPEAPPRSPWLISSRHSAHCPPPHPLSPASRPTEALTHAAVLSERQDPAPAPPLPYILYG